MTQNSDANGSSPFQQAAIQAVEALRSASGPAPYIPELNALLRKGTLIEAFEDYINTGDAATLCGNISPNNVSGRDIAAAFFKRFYSNVRDVICNSSNTTLRDKSDLTAKGTSTALAAWIMSALGVTSPMALGLASLCLIVLYEVSRKTFCEMTELEVNLVLDESRMSIAPNENSEAPRMNNAKQQSSSGGGIDFLSIH
jgi:hypothetical protein